MLIKYANRVIHFVNLVNLIILLYKINTNKNLKVHVL